MSRLELPLPLPLATGTGILALLVREPRPPAEVTIPTGVFGVLATLGLFCYELHGIEKCQHFITQGGELERRL
ncbi:hypothetical protein [Streptomyces sp. NPDC005374]|uniref:hypothetical protein n=1 Tax=Streptomyces sp. NPDC005374 TaxID=3364713 RepID=UPI003691F866